MIAGTVPDALRAAASSERGALSLYLDDGVRRLAADELLAEASSRAAALAARGVGPGDAVGILGPNRPEWAIWAFGVWLAGGAVVPFQFPVRVRDGDAFSEQTATFVKASGAALVLSDPHFLPALPDGIGLAWDTEVEDGSHGVDVGPEDVAVVQFTSGSTPEPKGVVLTHGSVAAAQRSVALATASKGEAERYAGWLPFFHDYGLFGFLLRPIFQQVEGFVAPTEAFARDPALWLRLIDSTKATITSGPSTAWAAAVKAGYRSGHRYDLSSLVVGVQAAEMISPETVGAVRAFGAPHGLRPEAVAGAYGLAEATLGVTVTRLHEGVRVEEVDPFSLAEGRAVAQADGKAVASCGAAMPGIDVRIAGADEVPLDDARVGEVQVRGPSVMRGYLGGDPDPFVDGWLHTGDLGYLHEGELFVVGRSKEIIVHLGRNYSPRDLEWAAERCDGVRAGRAAAFSGAEEGDAVIVVETDEEADPGAVAAEVRRAVGAAIGLAPSDVIVAPRGTVLKTTSGKLRRTAMRDAYLTGSFSRAG